MLKNLNTILTAADGFYFRTLCQFIYSFEHHREFENSEVICYDLGFNNAQLEHFKKLQKKIPNLHLRPFDFSKYPDFVKLHYKTYSFKPIIVREVFEEKQGNILWLDSATVLFKRLDYVWNEIDQHSLYAPIGGSGTLKEWTVQETLDYMSVPKVDYPKRNICGCMCGFGYKNGHVRELVNEWVKFSLIHECIKPASAHRSNHRDDQSLLTILLYKYQREKGLYLTRDEVNVSSAHPIDYLSVRNKLKPGFPHVLNFLSVFYFKITMKTDKLLHQLKA